MVEVKESPAAELGRLGGWRSQPAIQRVREAVSEIKKAARSDPLLAAEGSVLFLEKVSPALEHVDSSSGAIGTAVNHAIEELVSIIAKAPVDLQPACEIARSAVGCLCRGCHTVH